eukprot:CAMPEP_0173374950 /NCGR_PEP_ID=MMETSP1144-20121109/29370_1 /TAXON_ID=483371 /ORGANISM="non described non described, Strain CCMP2298" /LENGTH=62 /DNA_ID=CAMNT_0014327357 /DNA_START=182 /DNA_END=370 /DNA_ORIENTATION=+
MKTSSKLCTSSTLSNQLTTRSTLYEPYVPAVISRYSSMAADRISSLPLPSHTSCRRFDQKDL